MPAASTPVIALRPSGSDIATRLSIAELMDCCQHAQPADARRDDTFSLACGFELFRRAIREGDDSAWHAIVVLCRGRVLGWVRQHSTASQFADEGEYWVNRAFDRFWSAVTPERWSDFTDFVALLKYLKLCAYSVVVDDLRRQQRRIHGATLLDDIAEVVPDIRDDGLPEDVMAQDVWPVLVKLLPDAAERVVAQLSFVYGCKPSEIQARHPLRFKTVHEVYRLKANILDRLRRSSELRHVLRDGYED